MTVFEGREKAAEDKYSHDDELNFKVNIRTHKLLGLWAAELMHMNNTDAQAYADDIVQKDFNSSSENNIIARILNDVSAVGVDITIDDVTDELEHCRHIAHQQIYNN